MINAFALFCSALFCSCAVLSCAVLRCAVLSCAVLSCAVLGRAVLRCAVMGYNQHYTGGGSKFPQTLHAHVWYGSALILLKITILRDKIKTCCFHYSSNVIL